MESEYSITYTITIISLIITLLNIAIAIYLIRHFIQTSQEPKVERPKTITMIVHSRHDFSQDVFKLHQPEIESQHQKDIRIATYFKITASIILICNSLNALFNSLYCLHFIWDPMYDDGEFYTQHSSHIHRITSTFSWYFGKVALIWFFSGRLYYAFKGSLLKVNHKILMLVNILNTISAPGTLSLAYWAVYKQYLGVAELSFNIWRYVFQILVFSILYLFSQRLLQLTMIHQVNVVNHKREVSKSRDLGIDPSEIDKRESSSSSSHRQNIENMRYEQGGHHKTISFVQRKRDDIKFIKIVTRNAVLVFTISVTVALVTFCFFGFRFIFGEQTRITLLIPMNMAAFDGFITSICVLCMFKVGDRVYSMLFGKCCDPKCSGICSYFSVHLMVNGDNKSDEKSKRKSVLTGQKSDGQNDVELETKVPKQMKVNSNSSIKRPKEISV